MFYHTLLHITYWIKASHLICQISWQSQAIDNGIVLQTWLSLNHPSFAAVSKSSGCQSVEVICINFSSIALMGSFIHNLRSCCFYNSSVMMSNYPGQSRQNSSWLLLFKIIGAMLWIIHCWGIKRAPVKPSTGCIIALQNNWILFIFIYIEHLTVLHRLATGYMCKGKI